MKAAGLAVCGALALPVPVLAEPCVGPGFDRPLPGAVQSEQRFRDVPTARFPGIWQEGRIAGFSYQIASDLSAFVAPGFEAPEWQVVVLCDADAAGCEQRRTGDVPPGALPVAEMLGRCLLGEDLSGVTLVSGGGQTAIGLPPDAGVTDAGRIVGSGAGLATGARTRRARAGPRRMC
ncbi:hypothetical protein [Mangrovicoccus ximenensis]|uniref:hypothetical protein n=1 Tax=Mangrovicoccus ximenensis TaxID=1911570 RepID=UPI000D3DB30F|nr:hypothetical protein [Mangrovicoccus ximenensis]